MTRVLVCGGRDYDNEVALGIRLSHVDMKRGPISLLIHGGARGADALAGAWAAMNGIASKCYPADWAQYGRPAGPLRNQRMIDEGRPDLVVAFPGGQGTADMVRRARAAGVEVIEVGATK